MKEAPGETFEEQWEKIRQSPALNAVLTLMMKASIAPHSPDKSVEFRASQADFASGAKFAAEFIQTFGAPVVEKKRPEGDDLPEPEPWSHITGDKPADED